MPFRQIAASLCLALALSGASAKLIDQQRAQIVLLPLTQAAKTAVNSVPEERTLRAGDLISIFLSDKAELKFVEKEGQSSTLVPLDEPRYRQLSEQGGGQVPEAGIPALRGHAWRRFGAAKAGVVHLQIREAGQTQWFRFEIAPAPEFKYGSELRRSDKDQGRALSLTDYDRLLLDLPGEVADGWTAGPEASSGLKLVSVAQAADRRVILTFSVLAQNEGPVERALEIRSAKGAFTFSWRRAAVPLAR